MFRDYFKVDLWKMFAELSYFYKHMCAKDHHLQGTINWLVKDPEARDWLCGWWAFKDFRVTSERNHHNQLSKLSVHHYDVNGHVRKSQRVVRYL
jgi:hypothetical protein